MLSINNIHIGWKTNVKDKSSIRDCMIEMLQNEKQELLIQADCQKKMAGSKEKQKEFRLEACKFGAYYYNEEKIDDIKSRSVKFLKSDDVDSDRLKEDFKDAKKIKSEDLNFLYKREEELNKFEEDIKTNDGEPFPQKKKGIAKKIIDFVNAINGGDSNDN